MSNKKKIGKGSLKGKMPFISRMDFSEGHYLHREFDTDSYYVDVAKRILPVLMPLNDNRRSQDLMKEIAIALAHYLEDLVSHSGIWASFVTMCRERYGRALPFYTEEETVDCEEYPTVGGVRFLIWYYLNSAVENTLLNPNNPFLRRVSVIVAEILNSAYDDAPDTAGRPIFLSDEMSKVPLFYQVRNYCTWLCMDCYLTKLMDYDELMDEVADLMNDIFVSENDKLDEDKLIYGSLSYLSLNCKIGPVGATPSEWLYKIVALDTMEEEEKLLPIFAEIKSLTYKTYRIKRLERTSATLVDCYGKEYELSAYTLIGEEMPKDCREGDSCFASLVYFNGKWNVNGISMMSLRGEMYDEMKEIVRAKDKETSVKYDSLMERLKGNRIGGSVTFDGIRRKLQVVEGENTESLIDKDEWRDVLYFINKNAEISVMPEFARFVKYKGNRLYDKEAAKAGGVGVLMNKYDSTTEFRKYIVENNLIPDAAFNSVESAEAGHRLFQDNIRFLLDYVNTEMLVETDETRD